MEEQKNDILDASEENGDKSPYRVARFRITKSDPLYALCDDWSFKVKNLYNVGNFYIRQSMSGTKKQPEKRHENEDKIISDVNLITENFNIERKERFDAKGVRYDKNGKKIEFHPYKTLDEKNWFIPTRQLRTVLRRLKDPDYMALPSHIAQETLVLLDRAWKGYFNSLKAWKKNPNSFTAMPKIPKYLHKNGRQTVYITNTTALLCEREDGSHFLTLPKTDQIYDMKKAPLPEGKYVQTRIVPGGNCYWLEVVFEAEEKEICKNISSYKRVAFIDPGVSNFATVTSNTGTRPLIIKGGFAKSVNQFCNKQLSHYKSLLTMGQDPRYGQKSSRRIRNIMEKRNRQMEDFMHKASRIVVDWAEENKIEAIIVGQNHDWKRAINIGCVNNQNFVQIPYRKFISLLAYKAADKGIFVMEADEAYTSKASFLDEDIIPDFDPDMQGKHTFSGKRVTRGWYKSKTVGLNADVNGSANIGRKNCPHLEVTKEWKDSLLQTPEMISPVKTKKLPEPVRKIRKQILKEKSKPKGLAPAKSVG